MRFGIFPMVIALLLFAGLPAAAQEHEHDQHEHEQEHDQHEHGHDEHEGHGPAKSKPKHEPKHEVKPKPAGHEHQGHHAHSGLSPAQMIDRMSSPHGCGPGSYYYLAMSMCLPLPRVAGSG